MSYEPLHHKYRPQSFAALVGQDAIATTLTNAIRTEKIAPAYLFTGPRGTGKTSSARILAKSLNCLKSNKPTAEPCGVCEVCKGIVNGSALDVIEIDAASNTGVDNIREIIERAQFAPVQCRYKVYVIDECLTGDSLVQTSEGLIRIDDPNIKGKKVLSYNDASGAWEFKKVIRWLDQGERQTLVIKTTNREIRCTGNHLIRTEQGWIPAKDVKEGARILSPVNVNAEPSFISLGRMDAVGDLPEDTSGGTWTMAHSLSAQKEVHQFNFTQKDTPSKKIKSLPVGLQQSGIQQQQSFTKGVPQTGFITTQKWAQILAGNGWQTFNSIQFPRWTTNLEQVEFVKVDGVQRVYDIEVVENHNFVANGLLLHNCHMLSTAAFNSLLKTLEEPPLRVVFVLATTDPQRVLPTIISRCQRFDFRRIPLDAMVAHLSTIASKENIDVSPEALQLVAQVSQGGLRDAESLLDQLSLLSGQVTVERVWDLVGSCSEPDLMALLQAIAQNHPEAVLDCARKVMDRGREPLTVLQNLAGFYRDLLIAKTSPRRSDLVAVTPSTWKALCELAIRWDIRTILNGQKHLKDSEVQIKHTTQPRLWLEVTLLGLLPATNSSQSVEVVTATPSQPLQRTEPSCEHDGRVIPAANQVSQPKETQLEPTDTAAPVSQPIAATAPTPETSAAPPAPPEVISTANSPAHTALEPTTANADTDIDSIWQQVLDNLQPPATRALLSQQCRLLAFDGAVAQIGINSQPLLKLAKGKLPNVEAAFLKLLQQKVRVNLELATPTQAKTAPVNQPPGQAPLPQSSPATSAQPASAPAITEPVKHHTPMTSSSQAQMKSQSQPEMAAVTQPLQPPLGVLELPPTNTETDAPTTAADLEEDEVAVAAQRLAKAFSGEVLKLNLDSAFPNPAETTSLSPPTATPADSWYDADGEDEADDF